MDYFQVHAYVFYVFVVKVNGVFTFNILIVFLIVVRIEIPLCWNIFNPDILLKFYINSNNIFKINSWVCN